MGRRPIIQEILEPKEDTSISLNSSLSKKAVIRGRGAKKGHKDILVIESDDPQAVIDTLTDLQKAFVQEFLVDLNGTQAVIRAGYDTKNPNKIAHQLLNKPHVRYAIDALKAERAKNSDVTKDYVLKGIVRVIERCQKDDENFNANAVLRGYELLAKHLGLLVDRQEISGKDGEAIKYEQVKEEADDFTRSISSLAERARATNVVKLAKP
jgi:phage terminase small subunit